MGTTQQTARETFLTAAEVIERYRWGRTKGYEMLKSPGFPGSVGGRWRLDSLIDWEDQQIASNRTPSPATAPAPDWPTALPARRTGGRRKATVTR